MMIVTWNLHTDRVIESDIYLFEVFISEEFPSLNSGGRSLADTNSVYEL